MFTDQPVVDQPAETGEPVIQPAEPTVSVSKGQGQVEGEQPPADESQWYEKYTPEQVQKWEEADQNDQKWQAKNTQRAQELASKEREIAERESRISQEKFEIEERSKISRKIDYERPELTDEEKGQAVEKELEFTKLQRDYQNLKQRDEEYQREKDRKALESEFDEAEKFALDKFKITDKDILSRMRKSVKIDLYNSPNIAEFDINKAMAEEAKYWIGLSNAKNQASLSDKEANKQRPIQGTGNTPSSAPKQYATKEEAESAIIAKWNPHKG